jgi:hypothetical protein
VDPDRNQEVLFRSPLPVNGRGMVTGTGLKTRRASGMLNPKNR